MKRSIPTDAQDTLPTLDGAPNAAPFPYRDYVAAKTTLEAALKRGVFYGIVTGPSGAGKTSLVRELSAQVDRRQHQILYLSSTRVSLLGITRYFAQVLRVTPRRSSLETIKAIADLLQAQPTQLVAWIDEATGIPVETLGELRSIAEFSHEVPQIFSLVLSGLPELKTILEGPSLFALKRRISVRCTLEGLRREEIEAFLVHRFGSVDAKRVVIPIRDELFERARGVPALIDRVVRYTLEHSKGSIGDAELREALDVTGL